MTAPTNLVVGSLIQASGTKVAIDSGIAATNVATLSGSNTFTGVETFSSAPILSSLTSGNVIVSNGSSAVSSGPVSANILTAAANLVNGNLVSANGAKTTQDSGIAVSNVPTLSGANTWSGVNTFSAAPILSASALTTGTVLVTNGSSAVSSGPVATNIITAPTNLVSGNLVYATGAKTTADTGIASSNVPTLTGGNTWSGTNTFSAAPIFSASGLTSGNVLVSNGASAVTSGPISANILTAAGNLVSGNLVSANGAKTTNDSAIVVANVATLSGTQTFTGSNTFSGKIIASAATNQIQLVPGGSGNSVTLTTTNPATSTVITIPDPGATTDTFALLGKSQTFTGTNTFSFSPIISSLTSGNVIVGGGATALTSGPISANIVTAPANLVSGNLVQANGTKTVSDSGVALSNVALQNGNNTFTGNNNFNAVQSFSGSSTFSGNNIMSGNQTFSGTNTYSSKLILTPTTNQIQFQPGGTGNTTTLSAVTPATSTTITIPDPGSTADTFALLGRTQTFTGTNTFSTAPVFSTPLLVASGGTGANTLASGALLQGNGTSAITSSGILTTNLPTLSGTNVFTGSNTFSAGINGLTTTSPTAGQIGFHLVSTSSRVLQLV